MKDKNLIEIQEVSLHILATLIQISSDLLSQNGNQTEVKERARDITRQGEELAQKYISQAA